MPEVQRQPEAENSETMITINPMDLMEPREVTLKGKDGLPVRFGNLSEAINHIKEERDNADKIN